MRRPRPRRCGRRARPRPSPPARPSHQHTVQHPRDPLPGETAELAAHRSSSRPRNPNPGSAASFVARAPGPDLGRRAPAGRRRRGVRGGAAVQSTIDRRRPTAGPGSPGPVAPPRGRPRDARAPGTGAASPAVPGRGPGPVVRRDPGRAGAGQGASARTARSAPPAWPARSTGRSPGASGAARSSSAARSSPRKRPRGRPRKEAAA